MSRKRTAAFLFLSAGLAFPLFSADLQILLRVDGTYLAYSYDHNQVFGENVTFRLDPYAVACRYFKADLASRSFIAYGGVVLTRDSEKREADEVLFDPQKKDGLLVTYTDVVDIQSWDPERPLDEARQRGLLDKRGILDGVNLGKIRDSLIYATARTLEISSLLDVVGTDVTLFVEGIPSIGFKTFKLAGGGEQRTNGFSLDKIWFNKSQGLFGKASYFYEKEKSVRSSTEVYYEEHSILKNYAGLPRQLDLQTSTAWTISERLGLGIAGSYNSTSLWNTRLWLDTKSKGDKRSLLLDFAYNKPLQSRGEAWLGLQSKLDFQAMGVLQVQGRYEVHDQALLNLSYSNLLWKKVSLQALSSYSRILIGGTGRMSKIFTGDLNLAYNADRFSLAADYYLNNDLFGNQRLTRPQLRFGLKPVTFYGGLLSATLQNVFLVNTLRRDAGTATTFSNNTSVNLAAKPVFFGPGTSLQVNLALEQFLEKEGRNFTSGGLILRANRSFGSAVTVEGFYSLQSRRRSKGWLIEGTTSQDLSGVVRVNPGGRLNGWVSLSFDPKKGEWKQSFADVSIGIYKSWRFQSLLNYDFYRRKLNNVDLYLVREAGRFDLRFIWRSLSKQFLIELIPSL